MLTFIQIVLQYDATFKGGTTVYEKSSLGIIGTE
jgi:hypothetical protein